MWLGMVRSSLLQAVQLRVVGEWTGGFRCRVSAMCLGRPGAVVSRRRVSECAGFFESAGDVVSWVAGCVSEFMSSVVLVYSDGVYADRHPIALVSDRLREWL